MPVAGLCSVPFGGLLKSSRDFGIGFFVPAPLARAICWPWARKIRQWADFGRPQPSSAQLLLFSAPIRPKIPTILRVPGIFKDFILIKILIKIQFNSFSRHFILNRILKKIDLGQVQPPRLRKIRKRMVVPPSSRVLRSHARLAKSAGLAEALAFDSLC